MSEIRDSGEKPGAPPSRPRSAGKRHDSASGGRPGTGVYVYGIVPADVELTPDTFGVGDPPAPVRLVRHREIAALVSDVPADRPLGRAKDLVAHERLLDEATAEVPVLPLRFGAVVADGRAVLDELLAPHHDEFLATLTELEGRAQYVVKGRYVEQAILREVLMENPEAMGLREEIHGRPEQAAWDIRMRLGELINAGIVAKREADTDELVQTFAPFCVAIAVREPTHERDAVHLALLVPADRQPDMEKALDGAGTRWVGRVELRLLGPLAPYDFIRT